MKLSESLKNYSKTPFHANWHEWGDSNIIDDVNEFNNLLTMIYNSPIKEVALTEHGHFSKQIFGNAYAWSRTPSTNTFELILHYAGFIYKFVFWPGRYDEKGNKEKRNLSLLLWCRP